MISIAHQNRKDNPFFNKDLLKIMIYRVSISYKTEKTAKGLAKITQALSLYFAAILFGGAHIFAPLSEQRLVL